MTRMNYNRTVRYYPERYGCSHNWFNKSYKWEQCKTCLRYRVRRDYVIAEDRKRMKAARVEADRKRRSDAPAQSA